MGSEVDSPPCSSSERHPPLQCPTQHEENADGELPCVAFSGFIICKETGWKNLRLHTETSEYPTEREERSGGICPSTTPSPKAESRGSILCTKPKSPTPLPAHFARLCTSPDLSSANTGAKHLLSGRMCNSSTAKAALRHHVGAFPKNPLFPPKLPPTWHRRGARGHQPRSGTMRSPPAPGKGQYL